MEEGTGPKLEKEYVKVYILLCYVIMEQQNVYKLGKEYVKAIYVTLLI